MENTTNVIVCIKDGIVIDVTAPENISILVRDYDTPKQYGYVDLDKYEIKQDEDGDEYIETIW